MRFQIFPDGSGVSTQRQSWIHMNPHSVQLPLAAFMHCTVHREETWRNHKKTTYWYYCKHWQRPFQTRQGVIFICKASDTFQLPTFDVVSQQWSPDTLVYIIMFPNLINPIGKPLGLFLPSFFSPISGQIFGMIWFIVVPLCHFFFCIIFITSRGAIFFTNPWPFAVRPRCVARLSRAKSCCCMRWNRNPPGNWTWRSAKPRYLGRGATESTRVFGGLWNIIFPMISYYFMAIGKGHGIFLSPSSVAKLHYRPQE